MKRRDLAMTMLATTAASIGGGVTAFAQPAVTSAKTFVLVHGAFHGGWCWKQVAARLRQNGHVVYTPTLTGAGERSNLLTETVSLGTWSTDVANLIHYEELSDIILVGHSFGGLTISVVADEHKDKIRHLIYLDALMIHAGHSAFDERPAADVAKAVALAVENGGLSVPPPPPQAFGVADPDQVRRVASLMTPHPLAAYLGKLRLNNPIGNGVPATYIACTDPPLAPLEPSHEAAKALGWQYQTIKCGHDAMIIAPDELAVMLEKVS